MGFTLYTNPLYESGWFNELLCLELDKFLEDVENGLMPRLMIFAPPRSGKLLADETLVPTPCGYVNHGSLKVGDSVYGVDGRAIKVLGVSAKDNADIRVELTNGEVIYCHENHEWTVYDRAKRKVVTYETNHFMRATKFGNKVNLHHGTEGERGCHYVYNLPTSGALQGVDIDLVMPPYVLGAWLGDGSRSKPCITHDKNESEVIDGIKEYGYSVTTVCAHNLTGVLTTYFSGTVGVAGRMSKELDTLGLLSRKGRRIEKHIPKEYLKSTIDDRIQLLAGLIDTDGHIDNKSRMIFTSCERRLIDDAFELIESLGMRPYIVEHQPRLSTSGIQGRKVYWTVGFQPTMPIPCRLGRKIPTRFAEQRRVSIKSVSYDRKGRVGNCIQVDSDDGLYIVGRKHVVTHNSELASRRFPAKIIGKHPMWNIISCSYASPLAERMSRDVQRIILDKSYQEIYPDVTINSSNARVAAGAIRTAELWESVDADGKLHGGSYRAAGVNGGITGQGMNIGIIDDPAKDYKQASSKAYQESVKDWYDTTFYTRLDPKINGIIIILTRWHKDDLAGQLLEEAKNGGEQWRVVSFPMEAEKEEVHELKGIKYRLRKPGEILFPERMPQKFVDLCKARGSLVWNALYQQRPSAKGGGLIQTDWFGEYKVLPKIKYHTVIGDTAQKTKEHNDFSVFEHWGIGDDGYLYLIDLIRGKWDADELKKRAVAFWVKANGLDNGRCRWMGIEDKSSGTGLIQQIRNMNIPKIPVKAIQRPTDKYTRLMDVQGYIESGYVKLPNEATWLNDFLVECEGITPEFKTHDDQIDPMMDAIFEMLHQKKSSMFDAV